MYYHVHECDWWFNTKGPSENVCYNYRGSTNDGDEILKHYDLKSLRMSGKENSYWTKLHLARLKGTLPPELAMLTALELVDVGFQNLEGTIPKELAALQHLSKFSNQVLFTLS